MYFLLNMLLFLNWFMIFKGRVWYFVVKNIMISVNKIFIATETLEEKVKIWKCMIACMERDMVFGKDWVSPVIFHTLIFKNFQIVWKNIKNIRITLFSMLVREPLLLCNISISKKTYHFHFNLVSVCRRLYKIEDEG